MINKRAVLLLLCPDAAALPGAGGCPAQVQFQGHVPPPDVPEGERVPPSYFEDAVFVGDSIMASLELHGMFRGSAMPPPLASGLRTPWAGYLTPTWARKPWPRWWRWGMQQDICPPGRQHHREFRRWPGRRALCGFPFPAGGGLSGQADLCDFHPTQGARPHGEKGHSPA